MQTPELAP